MPIDVLARSTLAVGAVLGGTGFSILLIESARGRPLLASPLAKKWMTWTLLASLWLIALASPGAMFVILAGLGAVMGIEYARLGRISGIDLLVVLLAPVIALSALAFGASVGSVLIQLLIASTLLPLLTEDVDRGPIRIGRLLTGVVVVALPVMSIWVIAQDSGAILLALLFGVALSDVTAFTIGSIAGRRPLAPLVSPNKTWEGTAGNVIGAAIGVSIAGTITGLSWIVMVVLIPTIAIGAVWGDLLESLLKRHVNVKDAGRMLPGFGGVLDRVDSLIIAAPLIVLVLDLPIFRS